MLQSRHSRIAGAFQGDPEAGGSDGLLLALSPSHGLFDIVRTTNAVAKGSSMDFGRTRSRGQSTNLRLWETISGAAPVFGGLLFTMNAAIPTWRARAAPRFPPSWGVLVTGRGPVLFLSFYRDLQGPAGSPF